MPMTETLQITRSDDYLKGRADAERWMFERYGITVSQSPEPAGRVGAPKIASGAHLRPAASEVRQDDDVRYLQEYREDAADGASDSAAAARNRMLGRAGHRHDAAPTSSIRMDDVQRRLEARTVNGSPSGAASARRRMLLGADGICRNDELDSSEPSSSAAQAKRRMTLRG